MRKHHGFHLLVGIVVILGSAPTASSQGTFQNLNFEMTVLPPIPPGQSGGSVSPAAGIPGWSGYWGSVPATFVTHNDVSLGAANISILGPVGYSAAVLEGNFSVLLQASSEQNGAPVNTSIAQVGTIPTDAITMSLMVGGGDFQVDFNGTTLSLLPLSSGPDFSVFAADVSSFAGVNGELRLTALSTTARPFNGVFFDAITFSTLPVPEPGTMALLIAGAAMFLVGRRLKQ